MKLDLFHLLLVTFIRFVQSDLTKWWIKEQDWLVHLIDTNLYLGLIHVLHHDAVTV